MAQLLDVSEPGIARRLDHSGFSGKEEAFQYRNTRNLQAADGEALVYIRQSADPRSEGGVSFTASMSKQSETTTFCRGRLKSVRTHHVSSRKKHLHL